MSLWNSDTIKDVAESVGISNLHDDVAKNLAMDVEYRIHQVLQEALKFMRHGKRTVLATTDISHALRVLNVEPLYGYDSLRPLRFGEASVGPAQPIYYVEDEEVDFEKLINAPLPKVPREVTFTAHWLAIEGVQPAIPQNPTPSEAHRLSEGVPKGSNTTTSLAATTGNSENVAVKPLVKHILSKELQLYYDRVCSAILDEAPSSSLRSAALSSLRHDPGLHQLLPYFLQFVSEKVTQKLRDLFVLNTMLELLHALLENENLFVEPYVAAIVPPILTCLVGKRLGTEGGNHWDLRDFAASLIALVCKRFGGASHTLLSRLTRACLKHFLDPAKPLGTHYGAITGLAAIGGRESVRVLIVPNLKLYEKVLKKDDQDPEEVRRVVEAIFKAVETLEDKEVKMEEMEEGEELKDKLVKKIGEVVADRVWKTNRMPLVRAIVESRVGEK